PTRRTDTARDAVRLRERVPISDESYSRDTTLTKKYNSSPGPPSTSPSSLRYRTWSPRTYLRVRVGEFNPIPFGRQRDNTSLCFAFSADRLASERYFSDPLDRLTHGSTAVHMESLLQLQFPQALT
ncbi:hypothetical protein JTE90_015443, partial [Oedothorax gibbosus]